MTAMTTTPIPRPLVVDGVVVPDSANRTLHVRRPEAESAGYGLLCGGVMIFGVDTSLLPGFRRFHR